jgi:hypothetical protein
VVYETPFGSIDANTLNTQFGLPGIMNAHDSGQNDPDANRAHQILKSVSRDQTNSLAPNSISLVVPIDQPDGTRPNPWRYRLGNPTNAHNVESFDLWVEIKVRDGTRVIGNWKN